MAEKRHPIDHTLSVTGEALARASLYVLERVGFQWANRAPKKISQASSVDCIEAFADRRLGILRIPSSKDLSDIASVLEERLRPAGSKLAHCDWSQSERVVNVLTSAPYAVIGAHMLGKCETPWARAYAASQIGVGGVAAAYHASDGRLRKWLRRLDYWTIALASATMTRALYPGISPVLSTISVATTPFSPFLMSTANTLAMEAKYFRQAQKNHLLRKDHRAHVVAGGAGLALFMLDELRPNIPCNHAVWHLLSCYSIHKTLPLITDCGVNP